MINIHRDGGKTGKGVMIGEWAGKGVLGYEREINRLEHLGKF